MENIITTLYEKVVLPLATSTGWPLWVFWAITGWFGLLNLAFILKTITKPFRKNDR